MFACVVWDMYVCVCVVWDMYVCVVRVCVWLDGIAQYSSANFFTVIPT